MKEKGQIRKIHTLCPLVRRLRGAESRVFVHLFFSGQGRAVCVEMGLAYREHCFCPVRGFLFRDTQPPYRLCRSVVINALQSSLLFVGVFLALLYVFDIYDIGALVVFVFGFMLFFLLSVWWLISRRVLKRFRRMGLNFKRVIIIGAGPTGRMVAQELASDAGYGYRMMGVFDDDESVLGNIQGEFTAPLCEVADFVRLNKIDMIFIPFPRRMRKRYGV